MDKNELKNRTYQFARRCIKLAMSLPSNKLGRHIEGQLIRCATSVPANYRAALLAQSRPSFIAKTSIVIEEADESIFWLQLIIDEGLIKTELVMPLLNEAKEITAIFVQTRKTSSNNK